MPLNLRDRLKIAGKVRFTFTDPCDGRIVAIIETENLIVMNGKELTGGTLIAESGYTVGITYCAIGTDNTAPSLNDTDLGVETSRKVITNKTRNGAIITLSTFFTAAESSYNIKECGLFGHSSASATADSGILFCRALLSYDNSAGSYDLTIDWDITIE